MKKMFFAAAVAALAFAVNASAQFSVGVGYANEKVTDKTKYDVGEGVKGYSWQKSFMKLDGFYVEASYNWEFANMGASAISLQPGVRYTFLSASQLHNPLDTYPLIQTAKTNKKYENGSKMFSRSKSAFRNHLLDIPVNVKYSYEFVPDALKAYVFAGPVLSFGLAANYVNYETYKGTNGEETVKYRNVGTKYNVYNGKYTTRTYNPESKKVDTTKEQDNAYHLYNAFDLKLGLGVGITVCEKLDVKFGYNIGLLNRAAEKGDEDTKYSTHSNIMYFGVAYNF